MSDIWSGFKDIWSGYQPTDELKRVGEIITIISEWPTIVARWDAPLRLSNAANKRGHWALHSKASKQQRDLARTKTLDLESIGELVRLGELDRLAVAITRFAPKRMDSDGVIASAKHIRDGVAEALGIDDGDGRVTYLPVQQRKGKYAVTVHFFEVPTREEL